MNRILPRSPWLLSTALAAYAAGQQQDQNGPASSVLASLLTRAQTLDIPCAGEELSGLVRRAAAMPGGPDGQHPAFRTLLGELAIRVQLHEHAAAINRAYGMLMQQQSPLAATDFRKWAQVALQCADLDTMKSCVNRGLDAARQEDLFEQALLASLGTRMLCQLGMLERAAVWSKAGYDAAKGFEASAAIAGATPSYRQFVRRNAPKVLRNAILATADLHLLDGQHQKAQRALQALPDDDPYSQPYRLVIATLAGDRTAEAELEAICAAELAPRLLSMLAAKLVQIALLRNDNQLAHDRFERFRDRLEQPGELEEGRFAMLEIELALRGACTANAALRDRAQRAFAQLLKRWRNTPQMQSGVGFLHLDDRAALVCNLARLEHHLEPGGEGCKRAFAHVMAAHAASAPAAAPVDLQSVREHLLGNRSDHGLLVFVPGRLASALFVIDGQSAQLLPLPDAVQLRPQIDALMDVSLAALSAPASDAATAQWAESWQKPAELVADALLPPTAQAKISTWKRMTVCGAGMLQNAPMDLLRVTVDKRRQALGERLAIEYLANLPAAIAKPDRWNNGDMMLAGALLTTRDGKQRGLIGADRAQPLLSPYRRRPERVEARRRWNARSLLDQDIDQKKLLASLRAASILHLIGHGFDDSILFRDAPRVASLTRAQVAELELDGLVVILGSCNGGVAPWRRGGNPLSASLAGAMLKAGARCTMVAMADLQLGRHVESMVHVHTALAAGAAPADAMLAARQALRVANDPHAQLELQLMQLHGRGF